MKIDVDYIKMMIEELRNVELYMDTDGSIIYYDKNGEDIYVGKESVKEFSLSLPPWALLKEEN